MNSIRPIRCLLRSSSIHRSSSRTLFNVLEERRLLEGYLPQNKKLEMIEALKIKQTFYTGFDPTGPSLHIGHLLVIMPLIHALRNGHRIICLIGGETARIGDPIGRLKAREPLDRETIEANSSRISSTLASIFVNHLKYFWKPKFSESIHEPIILNNSNWYANDKFSDIIAECGPGINVRNLFRKNRVEDRSENYNYAQLSYAVMQAYDWLKLFDRHNCRFQIGGNDQTPNIEAGFSLIRNLRNQSVYGFFAPLLLDKEGKKMGKTEGNSLFLERFSNSPYSLYKAILKLPHNQIERFLRYFTFYNNQEIESIMQKNLKKKTLHAHEKLADSLVLLIHGESGLNQAKNATKALLGGETAALGQLTEDDLVEVFGSKSFIYHELVPDVTCLMDVIRKTNCFENEELATVMTNKGGVLVNGRKILDTGYIFNDNDIFPNNLTFIKIGTNRAYLIRWL